MNELAHRGLALRRVEFAVKILRDDHLGREQRPRLGHLDIFLLENDLARVIGDFGGAPVPFNLVERLDLGIAENALNARRFFRRADIGLDMATCRHRCGTTTAFMRRRNRNLFACVNHEIFLSRRSKFYFVTNHPTVLTQKTGRENRISQPAFRVFADRPIPSETPFSGQQTENIPYLLWLQENFEIKVTGTIFPNKIRQISRRHCTNGNLFAAVNKKFSATFFRVTPEISRSVSIAAI